MELDIILWIQQIASPFWDAFFQCITFLGEPVTVIVLLAVIYWTLDKDFGEQLAYTIITGFCLNGAVKDAFRLERPVGQPGVRSLRLETATGHSFPSGHTQNTACWTVAIARQRKKYWLWIGAAGLSLLVGLSRIYLGVHYPKDVIVGLLLGAATPFLTAALRRKIPQMEKLSALTLAVFLPMLFYAQSRDSFLAISIMTAFSASMYFQKRFSAKGWSAWQCRSKAEKAVRLGVGLLLLAVVYLPLELLLPDQVVWSCLQYGLLTFLAMGVYPCLFAAIHNLGRSLFRHR